MGSIILCRTVAIHTRMLYTIKVANQSMVPRTCCGNKDFDWWVRVRNVTGIFQYYLGFWLLPIIVYADMYISDLHS